MSLSGPLSPRPGFISNSFLFSHSCLTIFKKIASSLQKSLCLIAALDKIDRVGSLKKKLRDSLTRRSRRSSSKVMSVEIEDVRDADDLKAVDEFRQALVLDELLPEKHDDYHMLLRSFHFFFCSNETHHMLIIPCVLINFDRMLNIVKSPSHVRIEGHRLSLYRLNL